MLKLTRHFATRLRGVFGGPTGTYATSTGRAGQGSATLGVCEHLRLHLTSTYATHATHATPAAREHELATECARQLITLVGQNGSAVAKCLGAFDPATRANPAGLLLLHLAERVGDTATRDAMEGLRAGA
jgi:hypothetical protein